MMEWFLARGCPERAVNEEIDNIAFVENQCVGIPFGDTYHTQA